MGTDLSTIEPLTLPDLSRPDRMPSLPPWLAVLLAAMRSEYQRGRRTMTLPRDRMIGSSERATIEAHCRALEAVLDVRRTIERNGRLVGNDELVAEQVARVMHLPTAKTSEAGLEQRADDYTDALDDLPAWTVAAALRGWNRGTSAAVDDQAHNFRWAPAPAVLRKLAVIERWRVAGRAQDLRFLLGAEERIEFSEEYCAEMRAKLSVTIHKIFDAHIQGGRNEEILQPAAGYLRL